jgi:uncharacterized protein (TIGR02145 family)
MKKILLLMMCVPVMLSAQNGVDISDLSIETGAVTFDVSWAAATVPEGRVWVFVDYNKGGVMTRLPVTGGIVLPSGTVEKVDSNTKGVWVNGGDGFSGTVTLSFNSDAVGTVSGACAYASNYPPVAEYVTVQTIKFTGTPPFDLKLNTGTDHAYGNYNLLPGQTLESFTDKTGAPGIIVPAINTLTASASSFCEKTEGVRFALSGTQYGVRYQLYRDDSPVEGTTFTGTGSAATFSGSFNVPGRYVARSVAERPYCAATVSEPYIVQQNAAPIISAPPVSTGICRGSTAQLSVVASNASAYQWKKNGKNVTDGTGGTTANYITGVLTANATYTVVVSNMCSATSDVVLVEIKTVGCCDASGATTTFMAFDPCIDAPDASTWTLTDVRDNKNYKVRKLADGRYWMVQNLMFGTCTETSFRYDNSLGATTVTPTVAPGYVGHCRSNPTPGAGYLYNWPAVMNNEKAYEGSRERDLACKGADSGMVAPNPSYCRGICPEGWHVPTIDEYLQASRAFENSYNCRGEICWDGASRWEGVLGGACGSDGSLNDQGKYARYWSSTFDSIAAADIIYFYSGFTYLGLTSHYKGSGAPVRCVRNY